ncbi:MAG: thiamine phosphate synthase [Terriglobia bacterium]
MPSSFILCYITDRGGLPDGRLPLVLRQAIDAGIDIIQIREKDLATRPLMTLATAAVVQARDAKTQIVINDRLDVALTSKAAGIHLGRQSMPARRVREIAPENFLAGVSCHSLQEVRQAEMDGATYILLGPVFETPSKRSYGPPLSLRVLEQAASATAIPVYALGGITRERVLHCLNAGARGIAGIRIFQDAPSLRQRVREIRGLLETG